MISVNTQNKVLTTESKAMYVELVNVFDMLEVI